MVLWRGLSSISSSTEAELGEVVTFWAVEDYLCALVLSRSLPYPEGCNWLIEVLGRGWQLQLDLSSLSGCSPTSMFLLLADNFLGYCCLPAPWRSSMDSWNCRLCLFNPDQVNTCVHGLPRAGTHKRTILVPLCLSFYASLSLAVRWGKYFQTCASR